MGYLDPSGHWLDDSDTHDPQSPQYSNTNPYPHVVDANSYQWGGRSGYDVRDPFGQHHVNSGSEDEIARLRALGAGAANRQAVQMDNSQYNADRAAEAETRLGQGQLGGYYDRALAGNAPSVALEQQRMGLAGGMQQALAARAGARGNASLGGLQSAAAGTGMSAGMGAIGQGSSARGAEQAGLMAGNLSLSDQLRAADLQRQKLSQQQAYRQAQIEAQQLGYNDAMQLNAEKLAEDVGAQQLGANLTAEAQNQTVANNNARIIQAGNEAQKQKNDADTQAIVGTGSALLGAGLARGLQKK